MERPTRTPLGKVPLGMRTPGLGLLFFLIDHFRTEFSQAHSGAQADHVVCRVHFGDVFMCV